MARRPKAMAADGPDGDGRRELGVADRRRVAGPVDRAEEERQGQERQPGPEEAHLDVVQVEDRGQEGEPAATCFDLSEKCRNRKRAEVRARSPNTP
jgi:hypothetical protein